VAVARTVVGETAAAEQLSWEDQDLFFADQVAMNELVSFPGADTTGDAGGKSDVA
jgi:hypothetical protein